MNLIVSIFVASRQLQNQLELALTLFFLLKCPVFIACGISHQSAPLRLREKITFPLCSQQAFLEHLVTLPTVNEAIFLSTCNRTEIYCDSEASQQLRDVLAEYCNIPSDSLSPHWYSYEDQQGLKHALRVACGLDSMMIGEPQILGQFKQAYHQACELGSAKNTLKQVFPHIFRACKHIRNQSGIHAHPVSVAYAAAQRIIEAFPDLQNSQVFVIGSGDTASLVTKYLYQAGVKHFFITSRTEEQAKKLAAHYPAETVLITDLPNYLNTADIVITATACPVPFISKKMIEEALRKRQQKSIFLLDLAVPRNIAEDVAELKDVQLYNIDSLQTICETGRQERQHAARRAEVLVNDELEKFARQARLSHAKSLICHYRNHMTHLANQELLHARQQLSQGQDAQLILDSLTHKLLKKLTHLPTISLRRAAIEDEQPLLNFAESLYAQLSEPHETID